MSAALCHKLETFISLASPKIDEKADDLQKLSLKIWERPELGYEEHFAHSILSDFFEEQGFEVTREYTLPTAFRAAFGGEKAGPTVAVLCEYDALPGIGHGCGHNLIAVAGNIFLSFDSEPAPPPGEGALGVGRIRTKGVPFKGSRFIQE